MTKEEAIRRIKSWNLDSDDMEVLSAVVPELHESEDERIRKWIIEKVQGYADSGIPSTDEIQMANNALTYLEKQKENIEKEYVFRPLAGTEITIAAEQAIRRANEGDRLLLAFNGAYIPVRKGCNANKIVDIYESFIERQKEQSITANDLDGEIHRFFDDCIDVYEAKLYGSISERVIPVNCYELIARHFAKWGKRQKEQTEELSIRLNGLMQEYVKAGEDEKEQEHRLKCYQLFWDALEDSEFFEQKEQKHPDGCFTCDEYKKGYEAGRLNGITVGYNKAMKEQKPVKKEITLTNFEEILNTFLFDFANSPIEDCEPKEYIKKYSAEILKAAYTELNAQLKQDIFEAMQEGRREGYEAAKAEQRPVDDKTFEEWIDSWWKEHKEKAYPQITMDEKEYKNFCRGIRNMYQQKPAEWGEEDSDNLERVDNYLWMLDNYIGDDCATPQGKTDKIRGNIQEVLSPWLKSLPERFSLQPKQEWSEEDQKALDNSCFIIGSIDTYHDPILRQKCLDFLYELPKRFALPNKQEWIEEDINKIRSEEYTKGFNDAAFGGKLKGWNEEDEEIIYSLRSFLIQAEQSGRYGSVQIAQIEQCLNWLKSLRSQYLNITEM